MSEMRIAIIGQGRSGRNIHGKFFHSEMNDFCKVTVVVEKDASRRARAAEEYGCEVLADVSELFGRSDIDLVVNATYSHMHYGVTKELLEHGFNVLVEKPFARTEYECSELIRIAAEHRAVLAVFHQSLYNPMHLKIKEIIASGVLGDTVQVSLKYSGFARRWDWQTLQCFCAGGVYNTGPHPIGQALDFLGWDKNARVAYSRLGKCLTSGDSDDYAKIILDAPGKPTVDIEVISSDAYSSDQVFKVIGTHGTLVADNSKYKMTYIEPDKLPPRPVIRESLSDAEGYPVYCSEDIEKHVCEGEVKGSSFDVAVEQIYRDIYARLFEGKPLSVTPEKARDVIRVIEQCHVNTVMPVLY